MAGWLAALSAADERRKQALRDAGPRPERDPAVAAATECLRADYRRILVERPAEAQAQGLDRHLWMRCVYSTIELFRRKVRKAQDFLDQSAASTRGRAQDDAARESLRRATAGLAAALDDASRFYEDLLAELQRLGGVPLRLRPPRKPGADRAASAPAAPSIRILGTASAARAAERHGSPAAPDPPSVPGDGGGVASDFVAAGAQLEAESGEAGHDGPSQPADAIRALCASCLICLGDVERYRATLTPGRADEGACAAAEACYWQAQQLAPGLGNPHNQLAVLATYRSDHLRALAGYVRAILSPSPFVPTARDNLERLCRALLADRPPPPPARAEPAAQFGAGAWATETAHLYAGFCRLHAALWLRPAAEDSHRLSVQSSHVLARMRALAGAGQLDAHQLECAVIVAVGALHLPPHAAGNGTAAAGEVPAGEAGVDAPRGAAAAPRAVAGGWRPDEPSSLAEASPARVALETLALMAIALLPSVQPAAAAAVAGGASGSEGCGALSALLAALTPLLLWACGAPGALGQLPAPLRTQLLAGLAELGNALTLPTTELPAAAAELSVPPLTGAHVRWLGFTPIQAALAPLLHAAQHGGAPIGVPASDPAGLAAAHAAHIHLLLRRMANGESGRDGKIRIGLYWHTARRAFSCEPEEMQPPRAPHLAVSSAAEARLPSFASGPGAAMPTRKEPPPPSRCVVESTAGVGPSHSAAVHVQLERRPTPPNPDSLPPPRQLTGRGFPMPPPPPARPQPAAEGERRMGGLMTPSEIGGLTGWGDRTTLQPAAGFPPTNAPDPALFAPVAESSPGVRILDHPFAPLPQHTGAAAGSGWPGEGHVAADRLASEPGLSAFFGGEVDPRFEVLLEDPGASAGGAARARLPGASAGGFHGRGGAACTYEPRDAPAGGCAGALNGSLAPGSAEPPAGLDAHQMLAFVAGIQAEAAAFGGPAVTAPPPDTSAPPAPAPPNALGWYTHGGTSVAEPAHAFGAQAAGSTWGASATDGLPPAAAPSPFSAWPSFSADWPWGSPPQRAPSPRPWTGSLPGASSIWGAPLS